VFSLTSSTTYLLSSVPLYATIGALSSIIILVLIGILLAVYNLLDRGIIIVTKPRKKRKR
jgi:preprotein translocase subunit SecF